MIKKFKKGFTLIELVVVIAVIAILSAVSVVSYISITNRAKQSNDEQKINQVNLSLAAGEISGKPQTMYDALKVADADGFGPDRFKAESKDYTFAYKMSKNRFVILEKEKVVYPKDIETGDKADLWVFSDKGGDLRDGYSHYLRGEIKEAVTVDAGLDVGENAEIPSIDYVSNKEQTVIIRTAGAGTALNVDASKDTVKHYGEAGLVSITSVSKNSYHENGSSVLVKIANGRVVVNQKSEIGGIHAIATNDVFNDIAIAIVGNADIPTITRDAVSEEQQTTEGTYSKFVLEVQNLSSENAIDESPEYVWVNVVVDGSGNSTTSTDVASSKTEFNDQTRIPESSQSSAASVIADEAKTTLKFYDVSSEGLLTNALKAAEDKVFINVVDDFTISNTALFSRPTTIFGLGHEIQGSANRVFRVTVPSIDVEIYGLKITSICTATSDVRGISFDGASANSSLVLDGCTVSASFYTINAIPGADNLSITVRNGSVAAGWAAFNLYSNNSKVTIENSVLRGLNDKGESSWNNFNTITLDGNCLSKSKANVGTAGSHNTINISKSTIYADSRSNNKQFWVGIQYGAIDNKVVVDEQTRIINAFDEDMSGVLNIGYYCNYRKAVPHWDYYENNSTIKIGEQKLSLRTEFDGSGDLINVEYVIE